MRIIVYLVWLSEAINEPLGNTISKYYIDIYAPRSAIIFLHAVSDKRHRIRNKKCLTTQPGELQTANSWGAHKSHTEKPAAFSRRETILSAQPITARYNYKTARQCRLGRDARIALKLTWRCDCHSLQIKRASSSWLCCRYISLTAGVHLHFTQTLQ